jgi:hypothetical protein
MAGNIQQLIFDIIARDSASPAFAKMAATTKDASGNVSELSRRIDELGRKSATARVSLDGSKEAQASLDRIDAKLLTLQHRSANPNVSIEGAARAAAEVSALDLELDRLGKSGGSASTATSALSSLSGMGGMGALVAAGVALSPVIVTLGTGLAGLAVAGYSTISPIMKAAQATGGLQANMHKLNPEQQQLAQSLLGTASAYHTFAQELQPQVIAVFNAGIQVAAQLMRGIEPVAAATGTAFATFLGQFAKTLQDPQWQRFWVFMAATAPQDMQLLGNLIIDLTNDLPPLLEGLQPVATLLLRTADGAAKAAGMLALLLPAAEGSAKGTSGLGLALNYAAIGFELTNPPAAAAIGLFERLGGAGHRAAVGGAAAAKSMSMFLSGGISAALGGLSGNAQAYARHVQDAATATANLMKAQQTALNTQLAYGNAVLTSANDAATLQAKLKLSSGQIGLQTQAQRDSFGAAQTYISDLSNQATQAIASGKGVGAAMKAISDGLPLLDSAKTRNRQYWEEVRTLVGWLDRLRAEKAIQEVIRVWGTGAWSMAPGQRGPIPTKTFPTGQVAAGGMIRGGIPGRDSVPVLAMPGEVIVPAHMVTMGLVDHLRGSLPGFAAGGVVGSYSGSVAGLVPWTGRELNATAGAITAGVAAAIAAGIRTALATAGGTGGAGPGVAQWAPVVSKVLGLLGGQQPGDLGIVLSQMTTESGGNPLAVNKTDLNWLAGHPSVGLMQVIAGTYAMNAAGLYGYPPPVAYGVSENPEANIYAGLHYAMSRYGPGWRSVLGHGHGYDTGGLLPPGLSLAVNTTGKAEVIAGSGMARVEALLDELCGLVAENNALTAAVPARTGAGLGAALSGAGRRAAYKAMYR